MSSKLIDAMNEEIVNSNEQHRGSRNEILNESISTLPYSEVAHL